MKLDPNGSRPLKLDATGNLALGAHPAILGASCRSPCRIDLAFPTLHVRRRQLSYKVDCAPSVLGLLKYRLTAIQSRWRLQ